MADTKAQVEAEKWIRENELPRVFGQRFLQRSLQLRSKGEFKFDAVSDDNKIVAVISTSGGVTAGGKQGTSKLLKIRSDVYWFLMLESQPDRRILVFTDQAMIDLINEEKKEGEVSGRIRIAKGLPTCRLGRQSCGFSEDCGRRRQSENQLKGETLKRSTVSFCVRLHDLPHKFGTCLAS